MKRLAQVGLGLLALLLLVYIGGLAYFSSHFQPMTYINGIDFSLEEKDQVPETYLALWEDYQLKLEGRGDKEDSLKAQDFDYQASITEDQVPNQDPYGWFLTSFVRKDYELEAQESFDQEKFEALIQDLHVVKDEDIQDPSPAYIGHDEAGGYQVYDGQEGNRLDQEKLKGAILEATRGLDQVLDLDEADLYLKPGQGEDVAKLQAKADSLNELGGFSLTFKFGGQDIDLDGDSLLDLYMEAEDGSLVEDPEKVQAYVEDLATSLNTRGAARDFEITGGGTVRIPGGIYGWALDEAKTSQALMEALKSKKTQEIDLVFSQEAQVAGLDDIGPTYIEIDLSRQQLWLYEDGAQVLETPVVTGNVNQGKGTPTGTGMVWSRETNRRLQGETWDSFVNYWMPFNWSGGGMHDASWRSSFGGEIYKGGGSNGCVNLPPPITPEIFEKTFNGMPVVVYDSASQAI